MQTLNGYKVPKEILAAWDKKLVPEYDLLFFNSQPDFLSCEPLTTENKKLFTLDERTSFATWSLSNEAQYYTRLHNTWINELNEEQISEIVKQQWLSGRGLVFSHEDFTSLLAGMAEEETVGTVHTLKPASYTDPKGSQKVYMLQKTLWDKLTEKVKSQFVLNYATLWTDEDAVFSSLPENLKIEMTMEYPGLSMFFDTFPLQNGANCLAAAAAAVTSNTSVLQEWMMPERFADILEEYNYKKYESENLAQQDVLVWKTNEGQIVHAAFLLNENYCFNKHGQTMFNPWQVLKTEDVIRSWDNNEFSLYVYKKNRKGQA